MLTLKKPIELHTAFPLTMGADLFGRRILGNYALLGSRCAAKDLLYLMTVSPELPEDLGGMTTLVTQQNMTDNSSIRMDVVNNVINRILLDGSNQFTYQDQVYITSVLNQLGITDITQFMEEVRRTREENQSTLRLERLYQRELRTLRLRQSKQEEVPTLPLVSPEAKEDGKPGADPKQSMALSILERLDSARIFDMVHAFQRDQIRESNTLRSNALRLTEQLRLSRELRFAETKQQVFREPEIHFLHHWNRYEHMDLQNPARTEEQVLSQAAAAALLHAVETTLLEVQERPQLREQWLHAQTAFQQTAEHTLARFEHFHSEQGVSTVMQLPPEETVWNRYLEELHQYSSFYRQLYPQSETSAALPLSIEAGIREEELRLERIRTEFSRLWSSYVERSNSVVRQSEVADPDRLLPERAPEAARPAQPTLLPPDPAIPSTPQMVHTVSLLEEAEQDAEAEYTVPRIATETPVRHMDVLHRETLVLRKEGDALAAAEPLLPPQPGPTQLAPPELAFAEAPSASEQLVLTPEEEQAQQEAILQRLLERRQRDHLLVREDKTVLPEPLRNAPDIKLPLTPMELSESTIIMPDEDQATIPDAVRVERERILQRLEELRSHETRTLLRGGGVAAQATQKQQSPAASDPHTLPDLVLPESETEQQTQIEAEQPLEQTLLARLEELQKLKTQNLLRGDDHTVPPEQRQPGTEPPPRLELRQLLRTESETEQQTQVETEQTVERTLNERLEELRKLEIRTLLHREGQGSGSVQQRQTDEGKTVFEYPEPIQPTSETQTQTRTETERAVEQTLHERLSQMRERETQALRRSERTVVLPAQAQPAAEATPGSEAPNLIFATSAEDQLPVEQTGPSAEQLLIQRLTELHTLEERERQRLALWRSREVERQTEHRSEAELRQTVREAIRFFETPGEQQPFPELSTQSPVVQPPIQPPELIQRLAIELTESESPELLIQQLHEIDRQNRNTLELLASRIPVQPSPTTPPAPALDVRQTIETLRKVEERSLLQQTGTREDPERRSPAEPRSPELFQYLTPEQAEQEAPELLIQHLHEIDQQNRTTIETVERQVREQQRTSQKPPSVPDLQRTMQAALLSLEDPERAAAELQKIPATTQLEHRLTPEQEALLAQADPRERTLYEAIFAYQRSPEEAMQAGFLRPAAMGALQAALQAAGRSEEPLELEHPGAEAYRQTERLREQSEIILERFQNLPATTIRQELPSQGRTVKMVHKAAQPDVTEELLEQLQQRQLRSTAVERNEQRISSETTSDVRQIQQNVVTQTTEDITELVNRTLARQMRTISDQVYRQMERKLQIERNRRGRA